MVMENATRLPGLGDGWKLVWKMNIPRAPLPFTLHAPTEYQIIVQTHGGQHPRSDLPL